jgi:DNA-binding CsgD family transcriptional regulator
MPSPRRPESDSLVERGTERAALVRLLDESAAGRGGIGVIEGVAGSGKSALIELARDLARERGFTVLRARGSEIDRDVPMAVLRGLFGRLLARLPVAEREQVMHGAAAALAGALGFAEPQPLGDRRLHEGAYWLVADLADRGPLVLLVDDLQWVDAASLGALAAIGTRLDDLPVAVVLAWRAPHDKHPSPAWSQLAMAASASLHPAPLTKQGIATLLGEHAGLDDADGQMALRFREATSGNPLLVVQLVHALADAEPSLDEDGLERLAERVAAGLSPVLRMRLAHLGQDAVALAHAVAVCGDDHALSEVCAVAGISREAGLRAAATLARHGIFGREHVAAFAHPLVRAAIDDDLLAADRMRLRERVVGELLATGADAGRAAEQLLHVEPAGDPRAVDALRTAAGVARAAAAPARAAVLLRRALVELPEHDACRPVLDELIAAEIVAGDFAAVTPRLHQRLADDLAHGERAVLIRLLARVVMQTDGVPAAIALIDGELERLDADGRLLVQAEQLWMLLLCPPLTARVKPIVASYAGLAGDTPGERAMLALVAVALCYAPEQSATAITPIVARAYQDGVLLAHELPDSTVYAIASYSMILTDQLELAERELSGAARAARESGSGSGLAAALALRGAVRLQCGRICDAETDALTACDAGTSSLGVLNAMIVAQAVGVAVEARIELDDDAGALRVLADHGFEGTLDTGVGLRIAHHRAKAHLAAGRPLQALADVRRRLDEVGEWSNIVSHPAPTESLALLALGDRSAAVRVARAHLRRAEAWATASTVAAALRVTGLAEGGCEGIARLEEAVDMIEGSPAALELARCQLALGMLQRRVGQRVKALAVLRDAADLAYHLGAVRIATRAAEEMIRLGARPRRLATRGVDALTAAERRTAQLAADGHTNREIAQELYVSSKTVENRLGQCYSKLDIQSRKQLGEALAPQRPLVTT